MFEKKKSYGSRQGSPRRLTDRQRTARTRQLQEARSMTKADRQRAAGVQFDPTRRQSRSGGPRVTGLIVEELGKALGSVLRLDGPADVLMSKFFRNNHKLGSRDRSMIAEAIFYTLRHLSSISWQMKPIVPARAPKLTAMVALARIYGRDALDAKTVGNDAQPLDNILRSKVENATALVQSELPFWLFDRLNKQFGEGANDLFESMKEGAPLDLRVNLLKAKREEVLDALAEHGVEAFETPLSPDGVRLTTKPGLTSWPLYREGKIDVQDEGSQLIARLVQPRRGEMVCDFCAGAGGKTLALGALMRSTGRLYAFDVNEKRLAGMTPRMRRAGLSNVHPIAIKTERDTRVKRLVGKFDRVLVDAPCSGTGTLRRNPDLKWRMSEDELARINEIQKNVLDSASRLVKDGGRLVYATCSLLREENQGVVESFLDAHPDFVLVNAIDVLAKQGVTLPQCTQNEAPYFVMAPHQSGTDGFFGAVLERRKPQAQREEKREELEVDSDQKNDDAGENL